MKTNHRPFELILSLVGLSPTVRQLVSAEVQKRLFALGYRWSNARDNIPQHTNAENLRICSPGWNILDITWCDGPQDSCEGPAIFFTHENVRAFLANAMESCQVHYRKHGVDISITPTGIVLDATALLNKAMLDAKAVEKHYFGK